MSTGGRMDGWRSHRPRLRVQYHGWSRGDTHTPFHYISPGVNGCFDPVQVVVMMRGGGGLVECSRVLGAIYVNVQEKQN